MLFNSIQFLIFFPFVVTVFFLLPHKFRKYFLLAASYYFYLIFIPKYVLIPVFVTFIDFFSAILVRKFREEGKTFWQKFTFILAVVLNVGLLAYFKYLGLFEDTLNFFGHMIDMRTVVLPEVTLPIGISFLTFQSMGYLIDAYRCDEPVETNFIDFSLFILFFPQLVAGPIERSGNLKPQLKRESFLRYNNISIGGRRMLWGMFKKVVVADNVSMFADAVFKNVEGYSGFGLILGILAFAIQIYCDFSGYSDIAVGCAKIMDIDLMTNFDTPYFSGSVTEFWRRWHISLSTWFKDYLYIPLGGNRVSTPRWIFNQMVTFTVSGIWHGANFTFAVWGILNGLYIVISRFLQPIKKKLGSILHTEKIPRISKGISIIVTFSLISFTWIFFRANNFSDAFYVISNMFKSTSFDFSLIPEFRAWIAVFASILLLSIEGILKSKKVTSWYIKAPTLIRLSSYAILLAIIVIFGAYDNKSFIYFQF
jgi:Predicted membrane protein involved in D-alanine export